jgi:uncharacterized membrane protein YsdA (DUF1294 family)
MSARLRLVITRPEVNDDVTYRVGKDSQGRPQALDVAFYGEYSEQRPNTAQVIAALAAAAFFLTFVLGLAAVGRVPVAFCAVYWASSALAFFAYFVDKSAAEQGRWRTQEDTLHLLGLVGGWPGALVAQRLFRHKTRKPSFQVIFWGTVILNCGALARLLSPSGIAALELIVRGDG